MSGYDRVLRRVFPYVLVASADEVRAAARLLLEPREDFAAGGSSFAVAARPTWTLYLSRASAERLGDPRVTPPMWHKEETAD